MAKIILPPDEDDIIRGRRQVWHEDGDGWAIEQKYDLSSIARRTKAMYASHSDYRPWSGKGRPGSVAHHVAMIPQPVMENLVKERGWGFFKTKDFKRWLNDPDNSLWRTKPGKI